MANSDQCCAKPYFFFCDILAVESEGTAFVVLACTNCGQVKSNKIQVSQQGAKLRLLQEEKQKKGS